MRPMLLITFAVYFEFACRNGNRSDLYHHAL